MPEFYIGLMSGTSLDGIDAALVDFSDNRMRLHSFAYSPFSEQLKVQIQQLSQADAVISLLDYGALDAALGELFASTVQTLITKAKVPAAAIKAIGSHGQTVYHAPHAPYHFSLQIADPNIIAQRTGITTVADFRRRDIAAGGQGAPLVPAFHQAVFQQAGESRCVVNIGGIANITVLPAAVSEVVLGFDTGPGNTLMDYWVQRHTNSAYDVEGAWAATGIINYPWVKQLMQDSYFALPPPKSTGKEYFSYAWLHEKLTHVAGTPADIQASLCWLTATTIVAAIRDYAPATQQLLVCGGGVHNTYLMTLLAELLNRYAPACTMSSTEAFGVHPDHVEAMAFAWLARQTLLHKPVAMQAVTGAKTAVILGGIYL